MRVASTSSSVAAALVAASLLLARPTTSAGQLRVSGQVDLVGTVNRDSLDINTALRGDGPYNAVRLKVFLQSWITERVGVFAELLYDIDADPRVNGAYVVVNDLAGGPWLNARLGLAPSPMGSFGLRSTYFNANPLIGLPLLWQYRTNLQSDGTSTPASLVAATSEHGGGVPLLYDSCWNVQWEILGELGAFEYSVAITPGSLSNPVRSRQVGGSSWLARVGHTPAAGLRVGVSGAWGPYLSQPEPDAGGMPPYPGDPGSFDEGALGIDVEYQRGAWVVHSELFGFRLETPLVAERLSATSGYAELRYDFLPGWYAAGRVGAIVFGDVVTDPGTGASSPWDQDTYRSEIALGYRMSREVLVKLDWQRTTTADTDFELNLLAVQLSAVF